MPERDGGRIVAAAIGGWYFLVSLAELLAGVVGDGTLSTPSGTVLLEYAQPHNALHWLIVVGLAVAVLGPPRLRFILLVVLAVAFAGVNAQSFVDAQAAGEQLGHPDGLQLSYRLNNIVILLLAVLGAVLAHPAARAARRATAGPSV